MLRSIVAIALVATALSAPTWTQQLQAMPQFSQPHTTVLAPGTTDGAAETSSCTCHNCTNPYKTYGGAARLTKNECFKKCRDDANTPATDGDTTRNCLFALYDDAVPEMYTNTHVVHYEELGSGHCSDWEYLPEGGYPAHLTSGRLMDEHDRIRECGNRCADAWGKTGSSSRKTTISDKAFYVYNGASPQAKCACSSGTCSSREGNSSNYKSYSMRLNHDLSATTDYCWLYNFLPSASGNGNSHHTCYAMGTRAPTRPPTPSGWTTESDNKCVTDNAHTGDTYCENSGNGPENATGVTNFEDTTGTCIVKGLDLEGCERRCLSDKACAWVIGTARVAYTPGKVDGSTSHHSVHRPRSICRIFRPGENKTEVTLVQGNACTNGAHQFEAVYSKQ